MSLFNAIMYFTVAGYSLFLLLLVFRNIFGQIIIDNGVSMSNDTGEALVRGGMFVSGVAVFLVSFAYLIPVKEIIQKSFTEVVGANPSSIVLSVVCAGGGALSSGAILAALKEKNDRSLRMLLFLIGLLLGAMGYSYTIAFEADTPEGKLNTAFLPSIFFVVGSMLYAGFKYNRVPDTLTSGPTNNTPIYANAVSVNIGETFTDPHTGLVYELTDIQQVLSYSFCAIAYLTVPEDIANKRKPTSFREGQSGEFVFQGNQYKFIVERITPKTKMVDIRVVQTR